MQLREIINQAINTIYKIARPAFIVIFILTFFSQNQQNTVAAPLPLSITPITVNSITDTNDLTGGSGSCDTGSTVVLENSSIVPECTLRAAIETANSNNNLAEQDHIVFDIPGSGLKTINQSNGGYTIYEPILIDGYTQTGATKNNNPWPEGMDSNLTIEVDATDLTINTPSIVIESSNVTITGLILNGTNSSTQISILGINNVIEEVSIAGNYIGTDYSGLISKSSYSGILTSGNTSNFNQISIGGTNPEDRNVIAARRAALSIDGNSTSIEGNFIGVGSDGVTNLPADLDSNTQLTVLSGSNSIIKNNNIENSPNFGGIGLYDAPNSQIIGNILIGNRAGINIHGDAENTTIGDGTEGGRNIISGNNIAGDFAGVDEENGAITLDEVSGPLTIKGNYIGVADDGVTPFENRGSGIILKGETSQLSAIIGGTENDDMNIIANSSEHGIKFIGANQSSILGNKIYNNEKLGIKLGFDDNPTPNDPLDIDEGPNDLLNYPRIIQSVNNGSNSSIDYIVDVPVGDYRVEFFANTAYDPSGNGEGEEYLGFENITSLGLGAQQFNTLVNGTDLQNISATITQIDSSSPSGFGVTSEFGGLYVPSYDLELTKEIVDENTIYTENTISYNIGLTNNGPDSFPLSDYTSIDSGDILASALFNDIAPPGLSLQSIVGDVDCSEENSPSTFGSVLQDQDDQATVYSCIYSGSDTLLANDQTLNFSLTFELNSVSNVVMTNQALHIPNQNEETVELYQYAIDNNLDVTSYLNGQTSNNYVSASTTQPQADLAISKQLLTPTQNIQPGQEISYQLTYTNNGPDPLYLNANRTLFSSVPLFVDYLHPDLTISPSRVLSEDVMGPGSGVDIIDVGTNDLTCLSTPPGSAGALFGFTKYASYGLIACWHAGSGYSLTSGAGISAQIDLLIDNSSDLDFANYAFAYPSLGGSTDPEEDQLQESFNLGEDILDSLIRLSGNTGANVNNFARSLLPIDLSLSSSLIDPPSSIQMGTPINYQVSITNNGPASLNISHFNRFDYPLFGGLFSWDDLTLEGVEDPNITCLAVGPGSYLYLGAAAEDHIKYSLYSCVGKDEAELIVPPGETYSFILNFRVNSNPEARFGFYAYFPQINGDQDSFDLLGQFGSATEDILDTIINNNFTRVDYSGVVLESPSGGDNQSTNTNPLSETGNNTLTIIIVASALILSGVFYQTYKKYKSTLN